MKGLPPHLLEPFVTPPTKMSCWGTACRRMPRKFWRFLPEAASQALTLVPHFLVQQKHRLIRTKNVWTNLKPPRWKMKRLQSANAPAKPLDSGSPQWWWSRNAEVGNRRVEGRVKKVMSLSPGPADCKLNLPLRSLKETHLPTSIFQGWTVKLRVTVNFTKLISVLECVCGHKDIFFGYCKGIVFFFSPVIGTKSKTSLYI